jgi:uncharacterized membrane protein
MPPAAAKHSSATKEDRSGLIAGIAAFGTWGLIPVYWKLFTTISASEILAHRFVWTTAFLVGLLSWQQRWPEVREAIRSRRTLVYCIASGLAISVNWFCFIWAVNAGRVIETSLGYFMTPLVNVLFGATFLRERLTRWQLLSVLLALIGVLNLTVGYGRFPWLAITICVVRSLWIAAKKIRRPAYPWFVPGDDIAHSDRRALSDLSSAPRIFRFQFRWCLDDSAPNEHRDRDWRAARVVRSRRAASSVDHVGLPPIPVTQRQLFPRRFPLSRAVHADAPDHVHIHLDRAHHLHRRSNLALACRSRTRRSGRTSGPRRALTACAEIPNPKFQISNKSSKCKNLQRLGPAEFVPFWISELAWDLDFGIWDFPSRALP